MILSPGQTDQVTAIGPYAGWTSFGLAGLILLWLFLRHLPEKAKEMSAVIAMLNEQIAKAGEERRKTLEAYVAQADEQRRAAKEDVKYEREACAKHMQAAISSSQAHHAELMAELRKQTTAATTTAVAVQKMDEKQNGK